MLEGKYPIQRAPMALKLSFPAAVREEVRPKVAALGARIDSEDVRGELFVIFCQIPPDRRVSISTMSCSAPCMSWVAAACVLVTTLCVSTGAGVEPPAREPSLRNHFELVRQRPLKEPIFRRRFRELDALARGHAKDGGAVEVLQLSAASGHRGDTAAQPAAPQPAAPQAAPAAPRGEARAPGGNAAGGIRSATAPGVVFVSREELTAHMKSDWHKHNLKLKQDGKPMLSRDEFAEHQLLME